MAFLIDGKAIARDVRADVKARVKAFQAQTGVTPRLAVILAGENAASQVYVANKEKACGWVGIDSQVTRFPENVAEETVLDAVRRFNQDPTVNGILVQLPLPAGVSAQRVLDAIAPEKDVDGFHPLNAGRLMTGGSALMPCTPAGCMELIRRTGVELNGAEAVVIGRSNIVGKPMALMLLKENCTVTVCHSRTRDLRAHTRRADIVVCAAGQVGMLTGDMIKPGAVVIDVGISRRADGSIAGDVDFDSAAKVAGYLTPVPGGVGPMTIAMLMQNTIQAARQQYGG